MRTKLPDINTVRSIAWSFCRTTKWDFDCLYGVAVAEYVLVLNDGKFDPTRGMKFNSFLYKRIKNRLCTYVKKYDLPNDNQEDAYMDISLLNPRRTVSFIRAIESLSPEGRFIVNLVLNNPDEILDLDNGEYKLNRTAIKNYLKEKQQWTSNKINQSMREIKIMLRRLPC